MFKLSPGAGMKCKICLSPCIKKGWQSQKQKYFCKTCKLYQQSTYSYKRCDAEDKSTIIKLNNIGVGISGISRFTGISKASVINQIKKIASQLPAPLFIETQQIYEVDEMHTFINSKDNPCYIIYALNRETLKIIDFTIGQRTRENISKVISTLNCLNAKKIYTDKLNVYPGLIDKDLHFNQAHRTNHIERFNLTLRTHLKRLGRKTICFSKSAAMLNATLKIYFWV